MHLGTLLIHFELVLYVLSILLIASSSKVMISLKHLNYCEYDCANNTFITFKTVAQCQRPQSQSQPQPNDKNRNYIILVQTSFSVHFGIAWMTSINMKSVKTGTNFFFSFFVLFTLKSTIILFFFPPTK